MRLNKTHDRATLPTASDDAGHLAAAPPAVATLDQHIGARIRLARQALGVSMAELGFELGVTQQQVQKYECGQNRVSAVTLFRIATFTGVTIQSFYWDLEGCKPIAGGAALAYDEMREVRLLAAFRAMPDAGRRIDMVRLADQLVMTEPAVPGLCHRPDADITPRVLLVGDPAVGQATLAGLALAGCIGIPARDGMQALRLITAGLPIAALVTDHVMPGITGVDLIEDVALLRPGLPAMLIVDAPSAAVSWPRTPRVEVLARPFRLSMLLDRLAVLLGLPPACATPACATPACATPACATPASGSALATA